MITRCAKIKKKGTQKQPVQVFVSYQFSQIAFVIVTRIRIRPQEYLAGELPHPHFPAVGRHK